MIIKHISFYVYQERFIIEEDKMLLSKDINLDKSIKLKYRSINRIEFSEKYHYFLILLE